MFLLDTNVLSELRRRDKTDPKVAAWADDIHSSELFLSAITILEIEAGTLMLERRVKAQGAVLRAWIDGKVLAAFDGRVLSVDTAVAQPALVHRLKLVTRNVADFQGMGVGLLNPWE